jgi:hypothetical protein
MTNVESLTNNALGGGEYQPREQYGEILMDNILGLANAYANIRPHNQAIGLSTPMSQVETLWNMEAEKKNFIQPT